MATPGHRRSTTRSRTASRSSPSPARSAARAGHHRSFAAARAARDRARLDAVACAVSGVIAALPRRCSGGASFGDGLAHVVHGARHRHGDRRDAGGRARGEGRWPARAPRAPSGFRAVHGRRCWRCARWCSCRRGCRCCSSCSPPLLMLTFPPRVRGRGVGRRRHRDRERHRDGAGGRAVRRSCDVEPRCWSGRLLLQLFVATSCLHLVAGGHGVVGAPAPGRCATARSPITAATSSCACRPKGRLRTCRPRLRHVSAVSRRNSCGPRWDLMHPDDIPRASAAFQRITRDGRIGAYDLPHPAQGWARRVDRSRSPRASNSDDPDAPRGTHFFRRATSASECRRSPRSTKASRACAQSPTTCRR